MSTLNKLGAIAGGIMGGMNMRNALERQRLEEERIRQGMERDRQGFDWMKADRERADAERAKADEFLKTTWAYTPPAGMNTALGMESDEQTVSVDSASKDKGIDYNAIAKNGQQLEQRRAQAFTINDPRVAKVAELEYQRGYLKDMASFGDPTKDPIGYRNHAIKVSTAYAKPLTPEEAAQYQAAADAYKLQGAKKALEYAQAGEYEKAANYYNQNGDHTFVRVTGVDEKSQAGPMGKRLTGYLANGETKNLGNSFDRLVELGFGEAQLKRFYDANKDKREETKTANDTLKTKAEAARDYSYARGFGGGAGGSPKAVATMEWKAKAYAGIGIEKNLANAIAANPNFATTPEAVRKQAQFIVENSKDFAGKPTITIDSALQQAKGTMAQAQQIAVGSMQEGEPQPKQRDANFSKAVEYLNKATNQAEFNANVRALLKQGWKKEQIQEMTQ